MTDKEDAKTEFLQGAEEVLERANTDENFGITHSDELRQITEWQAQMLEEDDGSAEEYRERADMVKRLAAAG